MSDILGREKVEISSESSLMDDLNISSLEALTLLGGIENKTGVELNIQDMGNIVTVSDLVDIIMERITTDEEH